MSELFTYLTIPFLLAMFLAMNMGGSGTAPSFSAAYGSNVIRRQLIPGLFGIMVLAGALTAGKQVSLTLGKGLLAQSHFTPLNTSIILLSVSLSLLIANLIGIPQSTSQATVLSIVGAATAIGGLNAKKLFCEIIPTWFILPVIAFGVMLILSKWFFPLLKKKVFTDDYSHLKEHIVLKICLICASLYVAFSIGANNVANAAGPIASLTINEIGVEKIANSLPILILSVLIVAPCFAIGSSLLGHKPTKTTGKEIINVSPFYATVISVLIATLLLLVSTTKGIPTSLVQLNTGAFMALSVGKVGVKKTFQNKAVQKSLIVWMVSPVFSFLLTYVLLTIIK